jgi:hypothetical protein
MPPLWLTELAWAARPASPVYWFLMQIGMIAGFFTAWPVNAWLIRAGIKEAM